MEAINKDESFYYTERLKSLRLNTPGLKRFIALDRFKINYSPERCEINCDHVYSKSHSWGQVGNCAKGDVCFDFHPCLGSFFSDAF